MNRKLILLSLSACAVIATFFLYFNSTPNVDADTKSSLTKRLEIDKKVGNSFDSAQVSDEPTNETVSSLVEVNIKAYRAVIRSKLTAQGAVLANFTNSLNVELSLKNKDPFKGVAYNAKFESEDPETDIPAYLGFTFDYRAGEFSDVSMLGLQREHPLGIVQVLLTQLSYFDGIHSIELLDGIHTYLYEIDDNVVSRNKVENTINNTSSSYTTLSQNDIWNLTLDAYSFPSKLRTSTNKTIEMDGSTIELEQEITMTPIAPNGTVLAKANFGAQANARFAVKLNENAPEVIVDIDNFMDTLVTFDAKPTLDLAQVLGVFLVSQGWGYVRDLLESEDISDSMRSSLIFSLERSGEQEAEYLLSSIIEDNSLKEMDRLRAMMSIAKMGEVNSQVSLSALNNMLDHPNDLLAETALLNIGILGKQNPSMNSDVTALLTQRLSSEEAGYNELLAINNLGNVQLSERVLPYLKSEYSDERQVAASFLSKNKDMQGVLLTTMLNDDNPNVVKAITAGIETNTKGLQLTESYQAELRERLNTPDILAPTRDLLFAFLANNAPATPLNKSIARKILETPDVPDSTMKLAEELLIR